MSLKSDNKRLISFLKDNFKLSWDNEVADLINKYEDMQNSVTHLVFMYA